MTEAAALELRHVRLAEPVTLRPASLGPTPGGAGEGGSEEGVFVALDDSPPVRTVLTVVEGDRRRALEVAWVVEVVGGDDHGGSPVRGFYGRWVGDEALERAARVGTEHLEDGTPVVQPVVYDNSAVLDVSDTSMAMPAPVIVMDDDTGVVDTDDEDDQRHEASAARDEGPAEDASDSAEQAGASESAAEAQEASDAEDSGDAAESSPDAAESSPDAAESSPDAAESSPDAADADAPAKVGRKKRGRKRR